MEARKKNYLFKSEKGEEVEKHAGAEDIEIDLPAKELNKKRERLPAMKLTANGYQIKIGKAASGRIIGGDNKDVFDESKTARGIDASHRKYGENDRVLADLDEAFGNNKNRKSTNTIGRSSVKR